MGPTGGWTWEFSCGALYTLKRYKSEWAVQHTNKNTNTYQNDHFLLCGYIGLPARVITTLKSTEVSRSNAAYTRFLGCTK